MDPRLTGLGDLVAGSFLTAIGTLALLLSVLGRRRADPLLAAFGALALIYGVREVFSSALIGGLGVSALTANWVDSTSTYVINIPMWAFLWQFLDRGRRSLPFWWLIVTCLFGAAGIGSDLMQRAPGTLAGHPNNIMVVLSVAVIVVSLLRLRNRMTFELKVLTAGLAGFVLLALNSNLVALGVLPWRWQEESIGFLFFVGCLGFIAARNSLGNERRLASIEGELATARQIQLSLLPQQLPESEVLPVAVRFRPTSAVAGDFYDVLRPGRGRIGILIADVSGHGVPAALIASMVKVAVGSQQEVADRPAELLTRVNRALCGCIERGFVTASYVFVDVGAAELIVANAGHPPPLLVPGAGGGCRELGGQGPILGRFKVASFHQQRLTVAGGDRLVLYTDGLVEARDKTGEMYGEDRLRAFLGRRHPSVETLADALLSEIEAWAGRGATAALDDDLTLIALEVPPSP